MTTATLSAGTATQLTFPWDKPEIEQAATIVTPAALPRERAAEIIADSSVTVARHTVHLERSLEQSAESANGSTESVAPSLSAALRGDRIGQPFRMGAVMFRLLKSYGITDEEIAAGVATYRARRA